MPLVWNKKVFTLRQLNPGSYLADDPAGDVYYQHEWRGFSGANRICRIVCESSSNPRYAPVGAMQYITLKSNIIKQRSWAYMGRNDEGTYEPPAVTEDEAKQVAEELWQNWLKDGGLQETGNG